MKGSISISKEAAATQKKSESARLVVISKTVATEREKERLVGISKTVATEREKERLVVRNEEEDSSGGYLDYEDFCLGESGCGAILVTKRKRGGRNNKGTVNGNAGIGWTKRIIMRKNQPKSGRK